MTDHDDAIRACAIEARNEWCNDRLDPNCPDTPCVELGVMAIRRYIASRPPAPAPTGATLPEYPKCAPGPWGTDPIGEDTRIYDENGDSIVNMHPGFCNAEQSEIRDFILARVNARLPAPAAAPVGGPLDQEQAVITWALVWAERMDQIMAAWKASDPNWPPENRPQDVVELQKACAELSDEYRRLAEGAQTK